MRLALAVMGILIILASLWFRAVRKLTVDFTVMWGILGILLLLAGIITPLSVWIRECFAGAGRAAAVFGMVCLAAGAQFSLTLSRLTVKNQELAIEVSLLKQENARILTELEKDIRSKTKQDHEEWAYYDERFFADGCVGIEK